MDEDETPRVDEDDEQQQEQFNEEHDMMEIFSRFKDDPEQDFISINHLQAVLQTFGRNPSKKDAEQRIDELEAAGKTELTFEDIIALLDEPWTFANNDREELRRALQKFDRTQQGYLDIDEFRSAMSTLGEPLTDDELEGLIELGTSSADDGSGRQTIISIDHLLDQLLGNDGY